MPKFAFAAILFVAAEGLCQTPTKEPDALQMLLVEVRQLRQSIEAMTVASQRVQIALFALQMQHTAVARAAQRLDPLRNKCSGAEANKNQAAAMVQKLEARLSLGTATPVEAKEFQSALAQMKSQVESQTVEAQNCRGAEAEATSQLRNEEAKLLDLQSRIDRLDKALEKLGGGQ